ncbi:MAG TPA: FecR domain-containing protein, partial [Methylococcales bacterium]
LMKLNAGKIWSKVVRLASNSEFKVETTGAIAGVRGTECGFEVDAAGKLKEVQCLSGSVEVTDVAGTTTIASLVVPPAVPATPTSPAVSSVPQKLSLNPDTSTYVAAPMTTDETAAVNNAYYKDIPLNTSMVPYIISANGTAGGGTITVRNVNYFANIVNATMPPELARSVQANKLAVYAVVSGVISATPVIPLLLITDNPSSPYNLTGIPLGQSYVLRFEYRDTNDHIINASAYSQPPIEIKADTNLTQENLYPNLFTGSSPELTVQGTPSGYAIFNGSTTDNTFTIKATIANASPEAYTVTAVSNTPTFCPDGVVSLSSTGANLSGGTAATAPTTPSQVQEYNIAVNALVANKSCELNITAIPLSSTSGLQTLMKTISVQIINSAAKLILNYPSPDPTNIPYLQAGQPIDFKWIAPGITTGSFKLTVANVEPTSSPLEIPLPSLTANDSGMFVYPFTQPLVPGQYNWTVTLMDNSAQPEVQSAQFTIGQQVNVDFEVKLDDGTVILPVGTDQATIPAPAIGGVIKFTASTSMPGVYQWDLPGYSSSGTTTVPQTVSGQIDTSSVSVGTSKYSSVNLTIHDANGHTLGTKSKAITVVNNYPTLTADNFASQTITAQRGTGVQIPQLLFISSPTNISIPLDKCSQPLTSSYGAISGTTYTITTTGIATDTISCKILHGTNIQGHVAAADFTTTIGVTIQGSVNTCGNGAYDSGEACDDGNTVSGDGCSST